MAPQQAGAVYLAACQCTTPLGSARESWRALCDGTIALKPVPVEGIDGDPVLPLSLLSPLDAALPPRWLEPCRQLVADMPERPWGEPKYPVLISSSNFGIEQLLAFYRGGPAGLQAYSTPGTAVAAIAKACGFGPDCTVISNACVSAQLALHEGGVLLGTGLAEEVLILSFDFVSPFVAGGFAALKILNGDFPRPYTDEETGAIGLGDGLGCAVLSRERSDFRIAGSAAHQESYHMTANAPDGSGFLAVSERLKPFCRGQRIWIKGHGTGTLDAGKLEAQTLASAFPGSPLVSWKGSLGHTLGSCGLIEMAIAIEAICQGRSPGTPGSPSPFFADNVASRDFALDEFDGVALFSSAFGGAHMVTLIENDGA